MLMATYAIMLWTMAKAANANPTHGNPEWAAAVTLPVQGVEKR
jgi:hypothetical protein